MMKRGIMMAIALVVATVAQALVVCGSCGHEIRARGATVCGHCQTALPNARRHHAPEPIVEKDPRDIFSEAVKDAIRENLARADAHERKNEIGTAYFYVRNALALASLTELPPQKQESLITREKQIRHVMTRVNVTCSACRGDQKISVRKPLTLDSGVSLDSYASVPLSKPCPLCNARGSFMQYRPFPALKNMVNNGWRTFIVENTTAGNVGEGRAFVSPALHAALSLHQKVRLMHAFALPCEACQFMGFTECRACDGEGIIPCPGLCKNGILVQTKTSGLGRRKHQKTQLSVCEKCEGAGVVFCAPCAGRRLVTCVKCSGGGLAPLCKRCGGKGLQACRRCKGSGKARRGGGVCDACAGIGESMCNSCRGEGYQAH